MKNFTRTLCAISMLASTVSFADFSLAGAVACRGPGTSVTMNEAHTEFTVTQMGNTSTFDVTKPADSDGDTAVTYTGQLRFAHFKDEATLTLSDRGDKLEYEGKTTSLKCSN